MQSIDKRNFITKHWAIYVCFWCKKTKHFDNKYKFDETKWVRNASTFKFSSLFLFIWYVSVYIQSSISSQSTYSHTTFCRNRFFFFSSVHHRLSLVFVHATRTIVMVYLIKWFRCFAAGDFVVIDIQPDVVWLSYRSYRDDYVFSMRTFCVRHGFSNKITIKMTINDLISE